MAERNANVDYCGIINLLRCLVRAGGCTEKEANRIAARISVQSGIDITIPHGVFVANGE